MSDDGPASAAVEDETADLTARVRDNTSREPAWFLVEIMFFVSVMLGLQNVLRAAGLSYWMSLVALLPLLVLLVVLEFRVLTRPAPPETGARRYTPHRFHSPKPFAVVMAVHLVVSAAWSGLYRRLDLGWPVGLVGTLALAAFALGAAVWWYRTPVTEPG